MTRAGLCHFDEQLIEQGCDIAVNKLRTVVGMETEDGKWKLLDQILEDRDEEVFGDLFDAREYLKLGNFIDTLM